MGHFCLLIKTFEKCPSERVAILRGFRRLLWIACGLSAILRSFN